jgi:hypothetical protein
LTGIEFKIKGIDIVLIIALNAGKEDIQQPGNSRTERILKRHSGRIRKP